MLWDACITQERHKYLHKSFLNCNIKHKLRETARLVASTVSEGTIKWKYMKWNVGLLSQTHISMKTEEGVVRTEVGRINQKSVAQCGT